MLRLITLILTHACSGSRDLSSALQTWQASFSLNNQGISLKGSKAADRPLPGRFLYVGVLSAPQNIQRRQQVRAAFLTELRKAHPGRDVFSEFIVGHSSYKENGHVWGQTVSHELMELEQTLRAESQEFGDVRRIPLPEAYQNLPDKTLQLLMAGVEQRYSFIIKVDDDMMLNTMKAHEFFRQQDPMSLLYAGLYLWAKPEDPTQYGPQGDFAKYYDGPTYAVSYELARRITCDHRDHTGELVIYGSSTEDVDMGRWVAYEDEQSVLHGGGAVQYVTEPLAKKLEFQSP